MGDTASGLLKGRSGPHRRADSGLLLALDRAEPVFGAETDDDLRQLAQLLRGVDVNRPPKQVLDDPVVAAVGYRAAAILTAIGE